MDQKDDKKAGIPIPTLKDTMKPQLKIKGLQAGQSLVERLKQFKKKDLAFILAGLGVLFMAPLAEHFLMSPDAAGDGQFKEGWGFKPGAGGLGQGQSVFEGGLNGLAPGGAAGGGSDVITPLNVRDPSALVMGPGATQQPPATASAAAPAPEPAPSRGGSSDWKDALSQSAAKAGSAAVKRAALPVPKVPLSNGGLRGLGVASGGGGGSFNVGNVQGAQFGTGGRGDSTGMARASRDFRGAATRGGGSPNAGGFEQLKKQAAAAGSDISRAGSAAQNLEQAAGRNMGGGDAGGGGGAGGASDGKFGGNQDKGSKQMGESLEFLRLKAEQDKAIELKWEMIKKKAMFPIELQQEITKTLIMEPVKAIAGIPGTFLKGVPGSAASGKKYECDGGYSVAEGGVNGECDPKFENVPCFVPGFAKTKIAVTPGGANQVGNCKLVGGETSDTGRRNRETSPSQTAPEGSCPGKDQKPKAVGGQWKCENPDGTLSAPRASFDSAQGLNDACKQLNAQLTEWKDQTALVAELNKLKGVAGAAAGSAKSMFDQTAADCSPTAVERKGPAIVDAHREAYEKMDQGLQKVSAANTKLKEVNELKIKKELDVKVPAFHGTLKKDLASLAEADVTTAGTQKKAIVDYSGTDFSGDLSKIKGDLNPIVGDVTPDKQAEAALDVQNAALLFAAAKKTLDTSGQDLEKARQTLTSANADGVYSSVEGVANGLGNDGDKKRVKEITDAVKKAVSEVDTAGQSLDAAQKHMANLLEKPGESVVQDGAVDRTLKATKATEAWTKPAEADGKKGLKAFGAHVDSIVLPEAFKRAPTDAEKQSAANDQAPDHQAAKTVVDERKVFEDKWTAAKTKLEENVGANDADGAMLTMNEAVKASVAAGSKTQEKFQALRQTNAKSKVGTGNGVALGPGQVSGQ